MGSSKKVTVGYWYRLIMHFGWCRGPIDAFLEFRGGDRTAWKGELTNNGVIQINAENLWGGEKSEGGIVGSFDVRLGGQAQTPSSYLASQLGPEQSAYRGRAGGIFQGGRYGAFNPYPKPASFKLRRILKGWDNDAPWYPATASIPIGADRSPIPGTWPWANRSTGYFVIGAAQELSGSYFDFQGWWHGNIDCFRITKNVARYAQPSYTVPSTPFGGAGVDPHYSDVVLLLRMLGAEGSTTFTDDKGHAVQAFGGAHITTARSKFGGSSAYFDGIDDYLKATMGTDQNLGSGPWTMDAWVWLDSFRSHYYSRALFGYGPVDVGARDTAWYCIGDSWRYDQLEAGSVQQPGVLQNSAPYMQTGRWAFVSICWDGERYWLHQDGQLLTVTSNEFGMNPAHIIYDSLASADMQGEPVSSINDASFRAAADRFFQESFAICTKYDPDSESIEDFRQRICNVVGASCTRSRVDGLWYLDPIRGDHDLDSLLILTDDDIIEYQEDPSTLDDAVNQVVVSWFDPIRKETRATSPLQALGAIAAVGGVRSETVEYPEIPNEDLALRVAGRDLTSKSTPLKRFTLTTNRKPHALRLGQFVRLQLPLRGIADMVCMVGDVDSGTLRAGTIKLIAVQDVFSMPDTTYIVTEPGIDPQPPTTPEPPPAQAIIEAPYVELAGTLPNAELAALPADAGYMLTMGASPANGLNYSLWSKTGGEDFADQGVADWCPAATVVESASRLPSETAFTLAGVSNLDRVTIGTAALWGSELVRVDALDTTTSAVTFGRGVGDTPPVDHVAGERVWFYDAWSGSDQREYVAGETVSAKLLTRTTSQELPLSSATEISVVMDQRAQRPYAPGNVRVAGEYAPAGVLTGPLALTLAHRDRVLQADQLVDWGAGSVGPEPGVEYRARYYDDTTDVLVYEPATFTVDNASHDFPFTGAVRLELESVRGGLESWRAVVVRFMYENGGTELITTEAGEGLITEGGETVITEG